jgi:two-component system NtrC family sensor kinase
MSLFFLLISITFLIIFIKWQTQKIEKLLINQAVLFAQIAAHNIESGYYANLWPFEMLKMLTDSGNICYWRAINSEGKVILADEVSMQGRQLQDKGPITDRVLILDEKFSGEPIKVIINPLKIREKKELGFWTLWLGVWKKPIIQAQKQIIYTNLLLSIPIILLGLILAFSLSKGITNPLSQLVSAARIVSAGNLDYRIELRSRDEIGETAEAFNKMVEEVKKSRDKIEDYARTLEQRVEERTRELKATQMQLIQSAKMAAVGQLGAGVAHELNNPLGGILGYAQFILEKLKRPDFSLDNFKSCQRYIEIIEREATRCKKIVETLLTFSRRSISVNPQPLDIRKVIEEVLFFTGHQLRLKNVKVITDFKPDLSEVMGIANPLQQVFTNLILNAQQAMPEGGELSITAQNLIDENTQIPSKIKIEFADTGCGIPKENLSHIFEPFFTTKLKEKGTGLGLSLSYQIIQNHKGTIEVESQVGKGSVFIITLPAAK